MWIQVRAQDGEKSTYVSDLSMSLKVEDLRTKLVKEFNTPVSQQILLYHGKQLEDGFTLFDYGINLNDVVHFSTKPSSCELTVKNHNGNGESVNPLSACQDKIIKLECEVTDIPFSSDLFEDPKQSLYFKVGDQVDVKDMHCGAWFEAEIKDIIVDESQLEVNLCKIYANYGSENEAKYFAGHPVMSDNLQDDGFIYRIEFTRPDASGTSLDVKIKDICPRAKNIINYENINEGDIVMVNYNVHKPEELGYWYHCKIVSKRQTRTTKELTGTVYIGSDSTPLNGCKITYANEIFEIEKLSPLADRDVASQISKGYCLTRLTRIKCFCCEDFTTGQCVYHKCQICGNRNQPPKHIRCRKCDLPFHISCLDPPISELTINEEWFCQFCKNSVKVNVKLKRRSKETRGSSSHVWGKGMSCARRTKECTSVPKNHFGPIPGIKVGMRWKFRVQVSEAGVHRPTIGGIHGRENEGAYSIIFSGCYESDLDNGEEFQYTGSGSKDYSGKKCVPKQRCNQTLTKLNRALALNCAVSVNEKGAEAQNWKQGKPVRVVRNYKGKKYSKFCPDEGNRYDGIYKVVKYWKEMGNNGFLVWRFLLRRDDPTPMPWTAAGKKRIKEMGLEMQYPAGYTEATSQKENVRNGKRISKRCNSKRTETVTNNKWSDAKRLKFDGCSLSSEIISLIEKDSINEKLWNKCKEPLIEGFKKFCKEVQDSFCCVSCRKITVNPVTMECFHMLCKPCAEALFKDKVHMCPNCHCILSEQGSVVNETLSQILLKLLPGYSV